MLPVGWLPVSVTTAPWTTSLLAGPVGPAGPRGPGGRLSRSTERSPCAHRAWRPTTRTASVERVTHRCSTRVTVVPPACFLVFGVPVLAAAPDSPISPPISTHASGTSHVRARQGAIRVRRGRYMLTPYLVLSTWWRAGACLALPPC